MKKILILCVAAIAILSLSGCGKSKSGYDASKGLIGTDPADVPVFVDQLLDLDGQKKETAEFMEMSANLTYSSSNETPEAWITVEAVKRENKNTVLHFNYMSHLPQQAPSEIVLTDGDDNLIKEYDLFKDHLFKYSDVAKAIEKLPANMKLAAEKANYGNDGYVKSWRIDRDCEGELRMYITVQHKSSITTNKGYNFDKDGLPVE